MKKSSIKTSILALAIALLAPLALVAQQSGNTKESSSMIGKTSKAEFERINKEGAEKVKAISPTSQKLSEEDQALFLEVANAGNQQMLISQIAAQRATNPQVKELAQAEVEEQAGLATKLKEIATAKGIQLPNGVSTQTEEMLSRYNKISGGEVDRYYIAESAVKGHEKLDKLMSSVESKAKDSNLKEVAAAAHPLVRTHLKVSKEVLNTLSGGGTVGNK
ncbi:DUF4142 domain-containing protein [Xanthocytophaga agilis]|uniref:DUF4142 domain-containing protein n=1 Tax=Xanthocytophaga agilis TaxID=3048010 RepID=A0AAE3R3F1_9BACT|nr:DUF4142 domain-containing protein [Xanthocytophaga agilis]MDJ1500892.1 DUF4142 domain-containing protein [Xanthocytophaga agilis]